MNNLAIKNPKPSSFMGTDPSAPFLHLRGEELLDVMINQVFPGRIAVSSSIGAESAVLLDMVARINPVSTPE